MPSFKIVILVMLDYLDKIVESMKAVALGQLIKKEKHSKNGITELEEQIFYSNIGTFLKHFLRQKTVLDTNGSMLCQQ